MAEVFGMKVSERPESWHVIFAMKGEFGAVSCPRKYNVHVSLTERIRTSCQLQRPQAPNYTHFADLTFKLADLSSYLVIMSFKSV